MKRILGSLGLLLGASWGFAQEGDNFKKFDANADGQVTAAEVPEDKIPMFERLLTNSDKNADGQLSREEFTEAAQNRPAGKPAARPEGKGPSPGEKINPEEIIKRFDTNADGKLSKEEAPERMQQNFERLDSNADGLVDLTEFTLAVTRFNGAGKPPEGNPAPAFSQIDKNADGKITPDEIPEERREEFRQHLNKLGIEAADEDQFSQMMQALRERGGLPPRGAASPGQPGGFSPRGPLLMALDADKDGEISADEMTNAPTSLAQLDKNGEGKLSGPELAPPGGPFAGGSPPGNNAGGFNPAEMMMRRLKELDKNGDNRIQKSEAEGPLAANFDRADTNGDGELEESEVRQTLEKIRTKLREGGEEIREKVRELIEKKE